MAKSSVKLNLLYNTLYQILLIITPLITSPYVSRTLGSNGIGVYSYTYSVANCFALAGMLGVTNHGNRTIAEVQNDKKRRSEAFCNIFALQALMSVLVIMFYIVFVGFLYQGDNKGVFWVQLLVVLCSLCDINWYFFGVEKFKLTVTRNVIIKIANVTLIFLLVHRNEDTIIYSLIISGSLLLSNLSIWPFMKEEVELVKPDFRKMRVHLRQMLLLFIPVIAITLYRRMDKVMLGVMSTMSQTGIYENTEKIVNIPNSLIAALGTVMLPRMTYMFANGNKNKASKYISTSMEFACFAAVALMFGVAGVSNEFVPWFFGEEFIPVATLLTVIAPTIFFVSWANVIRTQFLIPLHHDKIYVASVWIGAIVNLIINLLLIPHYGALGAVIGTVCAEGIVMIYQSYMVRKELPICQYIGNGLFYLVPGIAMYCVIRLIGNRGGADFVTLLAEIAVGSAVFLLLCVPWFWYRHREETLSILKRLRGSAKNDTEKW